MPWGVSMPRHHHWPVTMQAGGVVLRPMRRADEARWTTTRELDCDWLGPWEATKPPGSHERVGGYRMMITRNRRRAKEGTFLPWAIGWDDGWPDRPALNRDTTPLIGQLTVSRVLCSVKCQEMVIVLSVSPGLLVRDSGRMGTVIEEG